jgi:3-isopropylmalate/(R)-2-methylmalate dehydratase large subunit
MSNDATTHITIDIFRKMGGVKVKSPDKIVFVVDHNVPSNSVQTAEVHKKMREFAISIYSKLEKIEFKKSD